MKITAQRVIHVIHVIVITFFSGHVLVFLNVVILLLFFFYFFYVTFFSLSSPDVLRVQTFGSGHS